MDDARRLDDILQSAYARHPMLTALVPPYHDVVAVGTHTITYCGTYDGIEHSLTYAPGGYGAVRVAV